MNKDGISVNPDQIKTIMDMPTPKSVKEIQILSGKITTLHRFISRSLDKIKPFTTMLKGTAKFEWTAECEDAFRKIKEYLTSPTLSIPKFGEIVFVCLATSDTTISSVLREINKTRSLVHYISRTLADVEVRYTIIEKYILSSVHCSRKLR